MQTWILVPMAWTACVLLAAWGLGGALLRLLVGPEAVTRDAGALGPIALVLGIGALAHAALALGIVRLLYPALVIGGTAAAAAWSLPGALRAARRSLSSLQRPALSDAPLLLAWLFALSYLPAALDPRLAHDDNVYHLALPKLYLAQHALAALPFNLFANMPHLIEVFYTIPMAAGGYVAPKVFVWAIHLVTLGALAAIARRILGRPWAGVACLLYLSGKNVQWHMGLAYVEPVIGLFLLAGAMAVSLRRETGEGRYARVAGVVCGLALASKYSAWPFAGALAAAGLISALRASAWPREARREAMVLVAVSALLLSPWLIKNALVTGNPIYPNAYRLLGGRGWSEIQEMQLGRSMAEAGGLPKTWRSYAAAPWRLTAQDAQYYCPSFSIAAMALFVVSLVLPSAYRGPAGFLPPVALAGALAWLFTVEQGRFLTAWTPVMIACGLLSLRPIARVRAAPAAAAALITAIAVWQIGAQKYPYAPPFEVFARPRADLEAENANYALCGALNNEAPPGGRVLSLWENRLFFLKRPYRADSAYEAPSGLAWLREVGDAGAFARVLADSGFTHVVVNTTNAEAYLGDALAVSMLDARIYPAARLERDRALLATLVSRHLEEIGHAGSVVGYRIKSEAR